MAAAVAAAADGLPEHGSLYFDYLARFPIGVSMGMELQPDADALGADEAAQLKFVVTKVGDDRWTGVPRFFGAECDTHALFEFVVEQ